ncbi:MAG: GAF domain-containing protein, partial [Proteobacteria bacterium]|nr:GAF domain-containing protein [Pseudomonadota bacterium]
MACEGFSEASVQELAARVNGPSIARAVIAEGREFAVEDLDNDPRNAAGHVTRREGLKSALFAPLVYEGRNLGCIALFSKRRSRYQGADIELLNATVQQLSLAIRTAEALSAERRQATMVSALYQLSHELSRLMTPREMAAHAFPIVRRELACKRMWLGILNDPGTHLLGQAGYGPGVRRALIDLQVNLSEPHEFMDEAVRRKEAVIVPAGTPMHCSGLDRLAARLELGMLVIVPLVSLGKVVGIMLLEPAMPSMAVVQRKLPLLQNMAAEIGTILLARRFEAKMAESDKMRMAGVLASGVAHNFNNLLQAIMGQASLIEMQLSKDSPSLQSTKMILEAAGRGAALIKQLMSFSMQGGSVRRTLSVNSTLGDSKELYQSLLGSRIAFSTQLSDGLPPIYADQGQLQQVITNLLMNAKEAIGDRKGGQVQVTTSEVRVRPGELDPELAPGIYVRVDVQDNGAGMDPERLAHCFEPFYTTKDLDVRTGVGLNGAGLGLSSSYSIVKQHEGLMTARSRAGEGSVFSVYLPA